jgi:formylglycine-generating enzyme
MKRFLCLLILVTGCIPDLLEPGDPVDTNDVLDSGTDVTGVDLDTGPDAPLDPDLDGGLDGGSTDLIACTTTTSDGVCLHIDDCEMQSVPGFCPGPTEIQCCVAPSDDACDENPTYEEMPRPNTGLVEGPGEGGCPSGMIGIDDFCVDRYLAALVEILADGSERHWSPFFNPAGRQVRAVSLAQAVPQGYITGQQAAAACAASEKRLCTDEEWLRACQGPSQFTYPYGNTRQAGVCNDARSVHPAIEYFGTSDPSIWSMLDNPCINQQADTVTLTGSLEGCITAEGAFDMMGNLHEWTSDPEGTFRGGFYADTTINGEGCLYRTTAHGTSHFDYSTGFRCCADPL